MVAVYFWINIHTLKQLHHVTSWVGQMTDQHSSVTVGSPSAPSPSCNGHMSLSNSLFLGFVDKQDAPVRKPDAPVLQHQHMHRSVQLDEVHLSFPPPPPPQAIIENNMALHYMINSVIYN